jgi:hypothetical protein
MMPRVSGKVANVISNTLLAINIGSDKGVAEGDIAYVMRHIEIEDPDTREELGSVRVSVLNLRVNHVQPKLCTAYVVSTQDIGQTNPIISRQTKRIVTQRSDEKQGISVYVKVGDIAEVDTKEKYSEEPPF